MIERRAFINIYSDILIKRLLSYFAMINLSASYCAFQFKLFEISHFSISINCCPFCCCNCMWKRKKSKKSGETKYRECWSVWKWSKCMKHHKLNAEFNNLVFSLHISFTSLHIRDRLFEPICSTLSSTVDLIEEAFWFHLIWRAQMKLSQFFYST